MSERKEKSSFEILSSLDISKHIKKKNGFDYISWAWAWTEVKLKFPDAIYTVYEDVNNNLYHTDGKTCWVKVGVTIKGLELIERYPIKDLRNNAIKLENVTCVDANKAIQRAKAKACASHGLGLYIYAGEDLPNQDVDSTEQKAMIRAIKKDIMTIADKIVTAKIMQAKEIAIITKDFIGNKKISECESFDYYEKLDNLKVKLKLIHSNKEKYSEIVLLDQKIRKNKINFDCLYFLGVNHVWQCTDSDKLRKAIEEMKEKLNGGN